jgi:ribosome-associated translation inhibitor RaiA
MQIQINAGNTECREEFAAQIETEVRDALSWFSGRITRVDVRLCDENGDKGGGDDKRCVIEARIHGRQPVAVTHHAATLKQATRGAADKLKVLVESIVGRLGTR